MSHWRDMKCDLKCSIDVMKRALLRINPEWEKHIEISADGSLAIDNRFTREQGRGGYNIKIKSQNNGGAKDLYYADMGLKRTADGSWEITVDPAGANYIKNLEGYVSAQIQQMRAMQLATLNGHKVINTEFDIDTGATITDIEIDTDIEQGSELYQ